jgi:hypothetical protein
VYQQPNGAPYFCCLISRVPLAEAKYHPFSNSHMSRGLFFAKVGSRWARRRLVCRRTSVPPSRLVLPARMPSTHARARARARAHTHTHTHTRPNHRRHRHHHSHHRTRPSMHAHTNTPRAHTARTHRWSSSVARGRSCRVLRRRRSSARRRVTY